MSRERKRKRGAPTHVGSLPLRPSPKMVRTANARFHAGLRLYNACLKEALRRSTQVKGDPAFEVAKALPKGQPGSPEREARSQAFRAIDAAHGFNEAALMSYASGLRSSFIREQVFAQEAQVIGRRAFRAVHDHHVGLRGKPRFKPVRRGLRSLEAKDGHGALQPVSNGAGRLKSLRWGKLQIPFASPKTLAEREEMARLEALIAGGKLLSCRIVSTIVRGRATFRAQFVMDGAPPVRHPVGTQRVSIDMGPSTAHVVSDTSILHRLLAPGVVPAGGALRRAQRKLDRQHRKSSPSCFDDQRRHKPGGCDWHERSRSAQRTQVKVAEFHRVLATRRDTEHGQLANQLIRLGSQLRAEKLNYVAWQKGFPRSVRDRAPGSFVAKLRYKAESAGGGLYEYDPRTTALSQACVCKRKAKKPLSQRIHSCECGAVADRD
ncbi:MAG: zinc ribbon domain-containing protein, partial [Candidatus Dormibacteria bacterium]